MEANNADKKVLWFEFLSCTWAISCKYASEKLKIFTQCIEIRSDSIKVDYFTG